jgi:DNA-binding XRE family transcriptional regulator
MEAMNGRRDHLIERRRRLGFTQESLAHVVGVSPFTVAQWERGNVTPRPRYRPALADALKVGVADVDRLLDPDSAVVLNGHSVSPWFSHYESLVHGAAKVYEVEVLAIPGLLQTRAYAEVIERAGEDLLCDEKIAERVDLRIRRQEILHRAEEPLELVAIIPQRLLGDNVGGPAVMADQLAHLEKMTRLPNIEIMVLPPDGRDASAISGFELLTNRGARGPFMACTFDVGGVRYHEDPDLIRRFVARFEHLKGAAVPLDLPSGVYSYNREKNQ